MKKVVKILLLFILAPTIIVGGRIMFLDYHDNNLEGTISDCQSGLPIAGANIRVTKNMSFFEAITFQWGGGKYSYATTNQSGKFSIGFSGNVFNAYITNEGYKDEYKYGEADKSQLGNICLTKRI